MHRSTVLHKLSPTRLVVSRVNGRHGTLTATLTNPGDEDELLYDRGRDFGAVRAQRGAG